MFMELRSSQVGQPFWAAAALPRGAPGRSPAAGRKARPHSSSTYSGQAPAQPLSLRLLAGRRRNILIHVEEVLRIVLRLDRRQTRIVPAIGGANALLALLHH